VGRYAPLREASPGVPWVRRPTGGRAVLHDEELTYAVVAPHRSLGGPRRAYREINTGLVKALRALGVPADLATSSGAAPPDAGPCFDRPETGEVVVGGRKLVGSAQVRVREALLQHGSIRLGRGARLLERRPSSGGEEPPGAVSLSELLERAPTWDCVAEALIGALSAQLPGTWESNSRRDALVDPDLEIRFLQLYESPEWTQRR
jgi:lipoate-protein ligase A